MGGMTGKGGSEPSAPQSVYVDPNRTANAQAKYNKEAGLQNRALNMMEQYTPQGSITYEATGETIDGIPQYRAVQSYNPEQQRLYESQTGMQQGFADIGTAQMAGAQDTLSTPFSTEQFGAAPQFSDEYRQQQMQNMLTRINPQMEQRRSALESQLANQGFVPGTAAYDTAIDEYNRSYNDALISADLQSTNIAGQQYGLEQQARQNQINEALLNRNQPLSEISSMYGYATPTSGAALPTVGGNINPVDYASMAYGSANMQNQAAQNLYNQQMGGYQSNLQGQYGLLGSGLMAAGYAWSDRRLKKNIEKIGVLTNGLFLYSFEYIWENVNQIGLMAQEVENLHPKAVLEICGFKMVNYEEAIK